MKRFLRNSFILLLPFLLMVLVNEFVRPTISEPSYTVKNIQAINSEIALTEKCSWNCHHQTSFCLKHHTALSSKGQEIVNPIYFGTIGLLKATGNYAVANILVYVVFFPILLFLLLIGILNKRAELKQLRNGTN